MSRSLVSSQKMCLLKLQLDQNSIVIYHKFNDNFKSHINFEMSYTA
jgi:hypothetical protein